MSFFTCLLTILRTVNLKFEDEEAVRKAFQDQFGPRGDQSGWDSSRSDSATSTKSQLEGIARMLDCRIRVCEEASQTTPLTPTSQFSRSFGPVEVINPAGTQQGWARWKSSAHDDFEAIRYTFGSVQPPPKLISAKGDLLSNLGWPELLKGLVQCQGNLEETLLRMRDDLDQEIKTSAVGNPITIAKLSRLEKILLELEEKAKVQAPRLGMSERDLLFCREVLGYQ